MLGVVLGGYLVALVLAWVAVSRHEARISAADAQASAGMHAFGEGLLFLAVFGILATVPTGAAVYFLLRARRSRGKTGQAGRAGPRASTGNPEEAQS